MSDARKPEQTGVRPILIVGLGGTGKQTLLQLRRMLLDAHGMPALPYVQFLMIDSDVRAVNLDGKELDEFFRACQFTEEEKIETPLAPADLELLQTHAQEYPHILHWFDPSLLTLPRPRDGNSQIRAFGRYAFITNYVKIRRRLEALRTKLQDQQLRTKVAQAYGIELEMGLIDCWVVFSIAGGTGAGMFIDMAYLLKDVFPQVKLQAIALTPDLFAPESETDQWVHRAFANGYASLMELENYNYQRDPSPTAADARFRVCWTREQYQARATRNPGVYEMTWLIGSKSRSDAGTVQPRDKEDVTQAMAEWLFMQIGSRSGTMARSMNSKASNWLPAVNSPAELIFTVNGHEIPMGASQAYGSFGLSKIYVPTDRIEALHTHRLSSDIVKVWLEDADTSSVSAVVEERFAEGLLLKNGEDGEIGHFLRKRLYTREGSDLFTALDEKFSQKRADFRNPSPGARRDIEKWLRQDIEIGLINEGDPNPERQGDYVRSVDRSNYDLATKALDSMLESILSGTTRSPKERTAFAEAVLKEVQRRYTNIAQEQRSRASGREEDIRIYRSAADRLLAISDDHGDFERTACIEVALEQYCISLKARLSRVSHLAAARLAERMAVLIGQGEIRERAGGGQELVGKGLVKELGDLRANLGRLGARLEERRRAIDGARKSTLNQAVLPSEEKREDTYRLNDGSAITTNVVYAVESRMFDQGDLGGASPWELRKVVAGTGQSRLIDQMLAQARRELKDITFDQFDVLAELDRTFGQDADKYAAEVRRLNDFAAPRWAKPDGHIANKKGAAAKPENFLLIAPPGSVEAHDRGHFLTELGRIIPEDEPANVDGAKDAIFLVLHVLGLPLAEWPNLGSWRKAYERIIDSRIENRAGSVLHTTLAVDLLPEILPPDTQEAGRLLISLKTCAQALALGVLQGEWEGTSHSSVNWSMKQKSAFGDETKRYGRFASTVRQVRQNSERGAALTARVSSVLGAATRIERIRAAAILSAMIAELKDDEMVKSGERAVSSAYAMKRSQPGWLDALELARKEIVDGVGSDQISEADMDDAWRHRDDWVAENPESSGFYAVRAGALQPS